LLLDIYFTKTSQYGILFYIFYILFITILDDFMKKLFFLAALFFNNVAFCSQLSLNPEPDEQQPSLSTLRRGGQDNYDVTARWINEYAENIDRLIDQDKAQAIADLLDSLSLPLIGKCYFVRFNRSLLETLTRKLSPDFQRYAALDAFTTSIKEVPSTYESKNRRLVARGKFIGNLDGLQVYSDNLISLELSDNRLENLECVPTMPFLETLNLANNRIRGLDGFRSVLKKLKFLVLDGNLIGDDGLAGRLMGAPHLRGLSLQRNQLTRIPALSGLANLEVLELNNNLIQFKGELQLPEKLHYVDLSGNPLKSMGEWFNFPVKHLFLDDIRDGEQIDLELLLKHLFLDDIRDGEQIDLELLRGVAVRSIWVMGNSIKPLSENVARKLASWKGDLCVSRDRIDAGTLARLQTLKNMTFGAGRKDDW